MKRQQHPHILELLAAFVDECDLWMIIPFVAGGSLESLLKRGYQKVGGVLSTLPRLRKASQSNFDHALLLQTACLTFIMRVNNDNLLHCKAWLDSSSATIALRHVPVLGRACEK